MKQEWPAFFRRCEMRQRGLQLTGVAATIAVLSFLMATVASQAPGARDGAAQTGQVLKTSWGDPDLQGLWSDEYQTPLQRPAKYAGKESFTDAERRQLDEERSKTFGFG